MKKSSYFILMLALITSVQLKAQNVNEKPKLVVGIVVDQMKQEYLTRFYGNFGEGGFKRFVEEGFIARNGHYNYSATNTGPGHASVYTGTTPAVHGIVNNSWYSRSLGRSVYCAEDTTVVAVGGTAKNGLISPMNLYSTTITDELKLYTQKQGKVIAMSIKDRGSALPGGHLSDGSYWYDSNTGEFMTSTYYMKDLPNWVKSFNSAKHVDKFLNMTWDTYLPIEKYSISGPDNSQYESGFKGKDTPTFPYNLKELRKDNGNFSLISSTPFGNSLLTEFAISAVDAEKLGQDNTPDFLAVSYSSTDYIGHNFGPQSKEVQDTYIRLDRELAKLFDALDQKVGKGNYSVFLTADHAVAENSLQMKDEGFKIDNFSNSNARKAVAAALSAKYGAKPWIESFSNNIHLNHKLIEAEGIDLYEMQSFVAAKMMEQNGVYIALTARDLVTNNYTKNIKNLLQNAYHTKESGDVLVVMDPGWQTGGSKGTGHGSSWTYDTHVPILFYGWGIKKGNSVREIHITDIAPSVSMLLNMRLPNGATGTPIIEMFK
ncbi:alkaline phosphatase [Roseivirga seohaensis subsp. aquiponti]|uniref:Alkaline phosphatase n=1 Tax=Roseivirga seohaensis subsp. aquiponti TaxID=1566026 RepID=A0A0L8ANZ0_9BACT|nr:alkaline phosphatase PafA [Roseivirga seohaensis]KOF04183.1 alkaline phosphatase [Roseivirga seohaensis subsp. aquiponti]